MPFSALGLLPAGLDRRLRKMLNDENLPSTGQMVLQGAGTSLPKIRRTDSHIKLGQVPLGQTFC